MAFFSEKFPRCTAVIYKRHILTQGHHMSVMGLLPDTKNRVLPMRRICRERFPRHRLQRKRLVNNPSMHQGTCVTHVPWCMSGSLTRGGEENVPGACATRNFTYLVRGPWRLRSSCVTDSSLPIPQKSPVNPGAHTQLKSSTKSSQVALFRQGFGVQSSMSIKSTMTRSSSIFT